MTTTTTVPSDTGIGAGAVADALRTQDTIVPQAPTITPGVTATQAAQPPVDPNSWLANLSEPNRVFLERKGIKDMETAVKSYSEAEKFMGVAADKLIKLPEETDTEGWNSVFSKLGRPEKSEDYGITLGDEPETKAFTDWVTKTFHENGVSKKAAQGIMTRYAEYIKGEDAKTDAAQTAKIETETAAIKQEWGAAYEQKLSVAKEFAAKSGIERDQIDAMEKSMGFAATLKFFENLGSKIGEHGFVSGATLMDGQLSPQAAREEIDSLSADFTNKLTAGDVETNKRFEQLNRNLLGMR